MATATLPVAPRVRGRNLLVGTGFAVAGCIMFFGGLFGIYFQQRAEVRSAGGEWIDPAAVIELTAPGMIMWTLLISIAVIQWAVYSIARDDRVHALWAVGATLAMGSMVIVQYAYQFMQMGLVADTQVSSSLIYTIAGAHLLMVIAAMVFVALMGFRALAGQYSSQQTDGIVAAAMFWDAAALIYFVLWIGVFIAK